MNEWKMNECCDCLAGALHQVQITTLLVNLLSFSLFSFNNRVSFANRTLEVCSKWEILHLQKLKLFLTPIFILFDKNDTMNRSWILQIT